MLILILISVSVLSFLIGSFLGKRVKVQVKRKPFEPEENELRNFLEYDGSIQ